MSMGSLAVLLAGAGGCKKEPEVSAADKTRWENFQKENARDTKVNADAYARRQQQLAAKRSQKPEGDSATAPKPAAPPDAGK